MSVLPRPTTSPMRTPPRLLRWWAAILTAAVWKSNSLSREVARDPELGETGPRLLREVIGHLQVDVVREGWPSRAPSSPR